MNYIACHKICLMSSLLLLNYVMNIKCIINCVDFNNNNNNEPYYLPGNGVFF